MRGSAVVACAVLVTLMVVAQLLICGGMQKSVTRASATLGTHFQSELDSHDVNDPEWQRASKLSREVMWLRKAVHNRASELFCVQLLLGAGAIGVLLVYGRKGRSSAKPDNLRTQADASADHDGNDKGE